MQEELKLIDEQLNKAFKNYFKGKLAKEKDLNIFIIELEKIKNEINNLLIIEKGQSAFDTIASKFGKANSYSEEGWGIRLNRSEEEDKVILQKYKQIQLEAYSLIQKIRNYFTNQNLVYGIGYKYDNKDGTKEQAIVMINEEEYMSLGPGYTRSTIDKLATQIENIGKLGKNEKEENIGKMLTKKATFYDKSKLKNVMEKAKNENSFFSVNIDIFENLTKGRKEGIKRSRKKKNDNKKDYKSFGGIKGWTLEDYFERYISKTKSTKARYIQDRFNAFQGGDVYYKIDGRYTQVQMKNENASIGASMGLIIKYIDELLKAFTMQNKSDGEFQNKLIELFIDKIDKNGKPKHILDESQKAAMQSIKMVVRAFERNALTK
jgi:hypothetical protein